MTALHLSPEEIELYAVGGHEELQLSVVETHLSECAACAEQLRAQARVEVALDALVEKATGFCPACDRLVLDPRCGHCGAALAPNGYRVERVLHQSPTGRMYLARDSAGRAVALKELVFTQVPSVVMLDAFEREAALLRQLSHPRIPKFVASFSEGEGVHLRLYLAQEYIEGESLRASLTQHRYTESEVREIADGVLDILVYLQGLFPPVFHRDIKPANLVRRASDQVVFLVDFGSARGAERTGSSMVGTPGFAPLEQLAGRVDASSDVFALGATLSCLLTRQEPVGGSPALLASVRPMLSSGFAEFLERSTQANPSKRLGSAVEAKTALQDATRRRTKTVRRGLAWGGGVAAGLAALLGILVHPFPQPVATSSALHAGALSSLPACTDDSLFPGAHWCAAPSPERLGYQRAGLERAKAYLGQLATTSAMVVVRGQTLLDYGDPATLGRVPGVRMGILGMLMGNYVQSGAIHLDSTLAELGITDVGGLTPQELEATVDDLMTSRSGVYHAASNPGDDAASAPPRGTKTHGTFFLQNNWDFNVLGTIFEERTHNGIYEALARDLAGPIQMEDFDVRRQRKLGDESRSTHLGYQVWLSTRDMSRLGQLMLERGKWGERQVIPANWVDHITQTVTPPSQMELTKRRQRDIGYARLWWTFDEPNGDPLHGAYVTMGQGGQYIAVIPKLDMVIAHRVQDGSGRQVTVEDLEELIRLLLASRDPPL
jgi:CubicO group peptidase (beta-lactamase class C family)